MTGVTSIHGWLIFRALQQLLPTEQRLGQWLNATQDVKGLIEILCLLLGKRKFRSEELLKLLCRKYIPFSKEEK
jgi:hypothetical protein